MKYLTMLMAFGLCLPAILAEPVSGSNDYRLPASEYITILKDSLQSTGPLAYGGNQEQTFEYARSIADSYLAEVAPQGILGRSREAILLEAQSPLTLSYDDKEYVRLIVQSEILIDLMRCEHGRHVPSISQDQLTKIEQQITETIETLEQIANKSLEGDFNSDEVSVYAERLIAAKLQMARNPANSAFKQIADPSQIKTLVDEFEQRLAGIAPQVSSQIAYPVGGKTYPENPEDYVAIRKKMVLDKIFGPALQLLGGHMSDETLQGIDYSYVAPQYQEIAERLSEVQARLDQERLDGARARLQIDTAPVGD